MFDFWKSLSRTAKNGLLISGVAIIAMLALASWWALHVEYEVLFSNLRPQDAQAMTSELEKLKIPYRLTDAGQAILVDAGAVHSTRIKLMGKELPLHGAVGLELFNNTDFGMTEFAQKINFQRALQGELTRTILSLAEVQDARVHIAMPEQGLFKQASAHAKAAITITLRRGESLHSDQVAGIQRLVAAAVPGMTVQDVTLVDNRGIALTRAAGADGANENSDHRLELKRDTENYLSKKADAVLEKVFGPGQALTSVDVILDMDQIRTTTEDVVGSPSKGAGGSTGVLVRERESLQDPLPPLETRKEGVGRNAGNSQREAEYAVGRRVEQVVALPGSIRRIQVVAVVRSPMDAAEAAQIQRLLSASVGADPERGDTVVVQTLNTQHSAAQASGVEALAPADAGLLAEGGKARLPAASLAPVQLIAFLLVLAISLGAVILWRRPSSPAVAPGLSPAQREAALQRIQEWMQAKNDMPSLKEPPARGSAQ